MYRDSDVDVIRAWLGTWGLKTIMCVEVFPSVNYRKGGLARDVEFLRACKGLQTVRNCHTKSLRKCEKVN
jgi:hypothetical protein